MRILKHLHVKIDPEAIYILDEYRIAARLETRHAALEQLLFQAVSPIPSDEHRRAIRTLTALRRAQEKRTGPTTT
ncbi:MAG: hypothetical protein WB764_02810 [Xanthobacteraceae bacterium]|jgi:hypothetical protein